MKLTEVSALSKIEMLVSMIEKLISNQIGVHLVSSDARGNPMKGRVWSISKQHRGYEVVYTEQNLDGTWQQHTDATLITPYEIERAELKKEDSGWYTFSFPNEEFDTVYGTAKKRTRK